MITQKLFSEEHPRKAFLPRQGIFRASFFLHELKRSWPRAFCFFLVLLLSLPIPLLFAVTQGARSNGNAMSVGERVARDFIDATGVYGFLAFGLAILAGIWATSYLYNKVSADQYHSLPIRREGLLLSEALVGLCDFAAALLVNGLLAQLILSARVDDISGFGATAGVVLTLCGTMLVVFIMTFMLAILCGVMSGTVLGQLILGGTAIGWLPLFMVSLILSADMHVSRIDIQAYIDMIPWDKLTPVVRLVHLGDRLFSWVEVLVWLGLGVLFLGLALVLYRVRKVERAGTPIAFRHLGYLIKYMLMILASFALGFLFEAIGSGLGWMFFGFIFGGFVSFLLLNVVLYKNPRQMFRGIGRLALYLAIFCVLYVGMALFCANVWDAWCPEPERVSRLELRLSYGVENSNITYTDPAVIRAATELYQDYIREGERTAVTDMGLVYPEGVDYFDYVDSYGDQWSVLGELPTAYLQMVFWEKGLPLASRTLMFSQDRLETLIRAVTESEDFKNAYLKMFDGKGNNYFANWVNEKMSYWGWGIEMATETETLMAALRQDFERGSVFDMFQTPTVGHIDYSNSLTGGRYYQNMGVTAGMSGFLSQLGAFKGEDVTPGTDLWEAVADQFLKESRDGGLVVRKGDRSVVVTGRQEIAQIFAALASFRGDNACLSPYTLLDTDYQVLLKWEPGDGYYSYDKGYRVHFFIRGQIPACVTEVLG